MSLTITAKNIKFLQDESEHNYVVTVSPAYKPLNIKAEGAYEIAPTGLQSHAFAQELILEPDTTYSPPRIVKMIRIRKKEGAKIGKITHRLGADNQALYVNLQADEPEKEVVSIPQTVKKEEKLPEKKPLIAQKAEVVSPKIEEKKVDPMTPPRVEIPKVEPVSLPKKETQKPIIQPVTPAAIIKTNRKEVFFTKIIENVLAAEILEITTQNLDKLQLQVNAPFRLSTDNRSFSQHLNLQMNPKGDNKQIYVQVLAPKAGAFTSQITCKQGDKLLANIFVKAIATKNPTAKKANKTVKPFPIKPVIAAASLIGVALLGFWLLGGKNSKKNTATSSATVMSTSNMALPADPACKPSLYQKLKEKTAAVKYSCVDRNCDTTMVREVLTFATGSKAFKYVSTHSAETPNECGEWVDKSFKNNEIDIIYTEMPCNIGNMDMSSSLCEDKKCVFMIPCGNSEGFLKVLNKEIRRRKAEKMKAALKIVRDEWKGNS